MNLSFVQHALFLYITVIGVVMTPTQSERLTSQHKKSGGVHHIFSTDAKLHDQNVAQITQLAQEYLAQEFSQLKFRYRSYISKEEINNCLQEIDSDLGQTLFVSNSRIKPDGGVIEVLDDNDKWRIILVTEAKHQGKDIENIKQGIKVGVNNDQDLMMAGNAIERAHKNIAEIANFMLLESHFPYVLFLEGSNFLTETITVPRPDGSVVTLEHNSGSLNRIDRLTAANYGMKINTNLCKNKFIKHEGSNTIMLQSASIYTSGDGQPWDKEQMFGIMIEIAKTSLQVLGRDLFFQLTNTK